MPNLTFIKQVSVGLTIGTSALLFSACGGGLDKPDFEPSPTLAPTFGPEPTPMPIPSSDHNILMNPGLELGGGDDFAGWHKWNGADNITAITSETCFGRGIQAVSTGDAAWNVQLASNPVETVVDAEYTATMWIKADMEGTTARFSTSPNALYQDGQSIGTEWQQIEWTFTANEASTTIVIDLGGSTATYNIDEIRLVPGGTPDSITCPRVTDEDGDFLFNGELESGVDDDFSGWNKWNGEENMTASIGEGCYGRALKAEGLGSDAWRVQFASDELPTVANTEYTASMWIKGSVDGGVVRFSTSPNAQYGGNETIGTDWQRISWSFTANDVTTALVLDLGQSEVTYDIDDIELVQGGSPNESVCPRAGADGNFVYNGGLELGSGDDFPGWSKWNGAENITATTEEVHSGGRAMQVVSTGTEKWNVQLASVPMPTVVGNSYVASMWIKAAAEGSSVRFSTNPNAMYQGDQTIGTEWQEVTWEFTANEASTTLIIDMGGSTETFYIDDLSVVED